MGETPWAPRTELHFIDGQSGAPVPDALKDSVVLGSSRGLGWDGVVAELGRSRAWAADDLAFEGHLMGLSLGRDPVTVEWKGPHGFSRVEVPPNHFWIVSAGVASTHRNLGDTYWGAIEVSRPKVRRVLGHDIELPLDYAFKDAVLARVARGLLSEVRSQGSCGALFADGLTTAMISRLGCLFGVQVGTRERPGALDRHLRKVIEHIEDGIGSRLLVASLAAIAGLSPAHFAKEFKRCTNETPHAFVMRRRLDRARAMIVRGVSLAIVADSCGFADQAHLTRAFKQRFGTTPTHFLNQLRK